jgi:phosphoribosylglycinamide formyltransferase-1
MVRLKLGVLISGRGSNLQALIDATADRDFPAETALVISNEPDAFGIQRAAAAKLPTQVIDHRNFPGRPDFEDALTQALARAEVDLVCLAGFMRLLTEGFVRRWWNRLINIHPSLLPAFRGLHTHRRVLDYGARFSGCTVHFVRPAMDDGPIIVQAVVPVLGDDNEDRLAQRVLSAEHRIYPLAVRLIAEGRIRIEAERVIVTAPDHPEGALLNPLPG